ncbi:MAG TPA: type I restriction-modification enzyme R subunit C-terminal domain-containing protein [Ktedonobacteraceae bacterium]
MTGKDTTATLQTIAEDASRLPNFVFEDPQQGQLARLCTSNDLAKAATADLDRVIDILAPQMKNRREQPNAFITLDLPDFIEMHGYILLKGGSERIYVDEYRKRVENHILLLIDTNPTIEALSHGKPVTDEQLIDLERSLHHDLTTGEFELSEDNIRKAYGKKVGSLLQFLRELFEFEDLPDYEDIVRRQFQAYINQRHYNADQLRFLRAVENVFLQKHRLQLPDLYESPFTAFGTDAVDRLFTPEQVRDILSFTEKLAA